jgi:hypothetical protein
MANRVPVNLRGLFSGEIRHWLGVREFIKFRATGEKRSPLKGEYYLSGAVVTAYRAPSDMSGDWWIAEAVLVVKCSTCCGSGYVAGKAIDLSRPFCKRCGASGVPMSYGICVDCEAAMTGVSRG